MRQVHLLVRQLNFLLARNMSIFLMFHAMVAQRRLFTPHASVDVVAPRERPNSDVLDNVHACSELSFQWHVSQTQLFPQGQTHVHGLTQTGQITPSSKYTSD